jgi:hypothetical protein
MVDKMTTFTTEDRIAATPKYPKVGSRWSDTAAKVFHVMAVIELDGHVWVHYEQDKIKESREFSCYLESFLARFKELPDDTTNWVR